MQAKDVLVYRKHEFSFSEFEKEMMQVVTCAGHVYVGKTLDCFCGQAGGDGLLILYLVTGEGSVTGEKKKAELDIRSTLILPLKEEFQLRLQKSELYYARVEGRYQSRYIGEGIKVFNYQFSKYSEYFFYNLMANVDTYGELSALAAASIVFRLYSDIDYFRKSFVKRSGDKCFEESIAYIETHYKEDISAKDIAQRSGYSVYHFNRKFKEILGVTPYRYVTQRRLLEAKNMLLSSNDTIERIALSCGFKSAVSFYKAFKNEFKLTPNAFKHKKR